MAHRKRQINLRPGRLHHQPVNRFGSRRRAAATQHEKVPVAARDVGDDFGGQQFLFAPDHDVLERVPDIVIAFEPLMDVLDIVHEREVEVGVECLHLVKIEGGKEPVLPSKRGVGVDQDVLVLLGQPQNFLEDRTPQGIEPGDGKIEDSPRRDIGGFGVHHASDMADGQLNAALMRKRADRLKIKPFIDADLSGNDGSHGFAGFYSIADRGTWTVWEKYMINALRSAWSDN